MRKVYVVGPNSRIRSMFLRRGWSLTENLDESVALIQFTGGEDVDPSYYGEARHPRTGSNPRRDAMEAAVFNEWKGKIPMAGICRGAQFLNVMNGGKLYQHVDNHAVMEGHLAYCHMTESYYEVTSTHHQMMIPAEGAKLLLTAEESSTRETADQVFEGPHVDTEAVFYPDTQTLCFQPHPEYVDINSPLQDLYFLYLKRLL